MIALRIMVRGGAGLVLAALLAIAASDVQRMNAQTVAAASTSGFEVASIRPHVGEDDHQEINLLPGGRYVGNVVDHVEPPSVNLAEGLGAVCSTGGSGECIGKRRL